MLEVWAALKQRHKKSKLSGRHNFIRKNFPDVVHKSFLMAYMRQKCVNRFCDIYVPNVRESLTIVQDMDVATIPQTMKYLSGKFSDCSKNFPVGLESFQTVRKLSSLSGNFPHCQENFQTIWKLSGTTGNFPDQLETFLTVWKLSRQSGNSLDQLETFQTV